MPGPSRSAQRGGPSDRRAGAQRQRRTRRPPAARHARRVSWSRRVGLAGALVLLVGGSIAFASQTLDHGKAQPAADVSPPAPPPVTLIQPATAITQASTVDLMLIAPANLRADQHYQVRVFVNDKPVDRVDLPGEGQVQLKKIPLEEGDNAIRATLVGDGGESPRSAAIGITRDDVAPQITIVEPTERVYDDTELLLGQTEPGADIHIVDAAGHEIPATIQRDGRFSAPIDLHLGNNVLTLRSTDAAGNKQTIDATIVRAVSAADMQLTVTPTEIYAPDLPRTVDITATLHDELGQPVDGTVVVFGVSPPDSATTTYTAQVDNGKARLTGVRLDPGDATGQYLVTALATLPSGLELHAGSSFSLLANAPKSPGRR